MLYDQVLAYNTEKYDLRALLDHAKLSKKEEITCREILRLAQAYIRSIYDYFENKGALALNGYLKLMQ